MAAAAATLRSLSGEAHAAATAMTFDSIDLQRRALSGRFDSLAAQPRAIGAWSQRLGDTGQGSFAGGQSALGALLFHPEFYVAAVANSGCHDNRMDKIWWNEQWMGWPVGPWYSASSNVDNAWRLQGHLLLVTGDMDHNVDPASTVQLADQLIKAGKDFDLLVVPGGDYGQRRLADFFVRWLQQAPRPDWNGAPSMSHSSLR